MKKLILGLAITASSLAFAQTTANTSLKPPITYGIKGGVNFTESLSTEFIEIHKEKVGFYAGGFLNIPISKHFSIQPEALYTMTGTKGRAYFASNDQWYDYTSTDYLLAVPVMLQYNFNPKIYLEAGPQATILLSRNTKIETNAGYFDSKNTFTVDLGIGAGYNITPNLGINARYVTNIGLQAGLSYKFK